MKLSKLKIIQFFLLLIFSVVISACGDKHGHDGHDHSGDKHKHGHQDEMSEIEQAVISELNAKREDGYIQDNIESERKSKADKAIQIDNAWVRELIPGQSMTAAYFNVKNVSAEEQIIVGVSSDIAEKAEIHESVNVDGRVMMEELSRLSLAPGQEWKFEPGGLHIMLMGVKEGVPLPNKSKFVFTMATGEQIVREFNLRSANAASGSKQHEAHVRH